MGSPESDSLQHLAMLRILYGACATALDASGPRTTRSTRNLWSTSRRWSSGRRVRSSACPRGSLRPRRPRRQSRCGRPRTGTVLLAVRTPLHRCPQGQEHPRIRIGQRRSRAEHVDHDLEEVIERHTEYAIVAVPEDLVPDPA